MSASRSHAFPRAKLSETGPPPNHLCAAAVEARLKQADAAMEQARAWHRIADVGEATLEALKPAADTIHSLGRRLDALCKWLTGKWPWIALVALLVISRTVNAAPDEVPKLIDGLAHFIKAIG